MKYSLRYMFLSATLLCMAASCIKEDISRCNPGVFLKFDYSLNKARTNLFEAEVSRVTVFVFDANGFFVDSFAEKGPQLNNNYKMLLSLPPGKYTVVTWCGLLNNYAIGEYDNELNHFRTALKKGSTTLQQFMLMAENDSGRLVNLDNLYHGSTEVESVYWPENATTVHLTKDTNTIVVRVKDRTVGGHTPVAAYMAYCVGTNARYLCDNSIAPYARETTYLPHQTSSVAGELVEGITVLRLVVGNALRLVVNDKNGNAVYDNDLVETMMRTGHFATQEDFDREDHYEVVLTMDKDVAVEVTINGWKAVDVDPVVRKTDVAN